MYTGESIRVIGELSVTAIYGNQSKKFTVYIVPGRGPTLLGRNWLQNIQLDWKRITMITKYPLQHLLET